MAGLERLTFHNRFTRLESAEEAIVSMRDLASPTAAFVREKCMTGATREIEPDSLYGAYKVWCEDNEHPKASKHAFGRDLRAAVPSILKERRGTGRTATRFTLESRCGRPGTRGRAPTMSRGASCEPTIRNCYGCHGGDPDPPLGFTEPR